MGAYNIADKYVLFNVIRGVYNSEVYSRSPTVIFDRREYYLLLLITSINSLALIYQC
jgi:hypothetical protein